MVMRARLNWCWRLGATAFGFSLFGIGGLCLALGWFAPMRLFVRDPERRRRLAQASIRQSFRAFLVTVRFLGVLDYRIEGQGLLLQDRRCLIVANHPTLIDYVLIASVLPECDCIVKQALWHNFFLRGVVRAADYIPNIETLDLFARCQQRLDRGGVLLIFPEGTRTRPGQPLKLQRGAANIAVRTGTDLRLVLIDCQPPTFTKQDKWYQVPRTKPMFRVEVKERVAVQPFIENAPSEAIAARRLTDFLNKALVPSVARDAAPLPELTMQVSQ